MVKRLRVIPPASRGRQETRKRREFDSTPVLSQGVRGFDGYESPMGNVYRKRVRVPPRPLDTSQQGGEAMRPESQTIMWFLLYIKYSVERPHGVSRQRWNAMLSWYQARLAEGEIPFK